MEDAPNHESKAASLVASLLIKAVSLFWLLFLYVAVMWFWGSQNIITGISGASALLLCFISLFVPVNDKYFKFVLSIIVLLSILFYASQWLWRVYKTWQAAQIVRSHSLGGFAASRLAPLGKTLCLI